MSADRRFAFRVPVTLFVGLSLLPLALIPVLSGYILPGGAVWVAGELCVALDRVDLFRDARQDGRGVPGARSDLEHAIMPVDEHGRVGTPSGMRDAAELIASARGAS